MSVEHVKEAFYSASSLGSSPDVEGASLGFASRAIHSAEEESPDLSKRRIRPQTADPRRHFGILSTISSDIDVPDYLRDFISQEEFNITSYSFKSFVLKHSRGISYLIRKTIMSREEVAFLDPETKVLALKNHKEITILTARGIDFYSLDIFVKIVVLKRAKEILFLIDKGVRWEDFLCHLDSMNLNFICDEHIHAINVIDRLSKPKKGEFVNWERLLCMLYNFPSVLKLREKRILPSVLVKIRSDYIFNMILLYGDSFLELISLGIRYECLI